jgi:hypothetical protein
MIEKETFSVGVKALYFHPNALLWNEEALGISDAINGVLIATTMLR